MTEYEYQKKSKQELIALLEAAKTNEEALIRRIETLETELNTRRITIKEAGSIAEASLMLNRVMENAQQAADDYLGSVIAAKGEADAEIRRLKEQSEAEAAVLVHRAQERADALKAQSEAEAQELKERTESEARTLMAQSESAARALKEQSESEAGALMQMAKERSVQMKEAADLAVLNRWNAFERKVKAVLLQYEELRVLLEKQNFETEKDYEDLADSSWSDETEQIKTDAGADG